MSLSLLNWHCRLCKAVTQSVVDLNTGTRAEERAPMKLRAACHHCNADMTKTLRPNQ